MMLIIFTMDYFLLSKQTLNAKEQLFLQTNKYYFSFNIIFPEK